MISSGRSGSSGLSALALEFGGCVVDALGTQRSGLLDSPHLAWVVESVLFRCSTNPIVSYRGEGEPLLLGASSEIPSDLFLRRQNAKPKM